MPVEPVSPLPELPDAPFPDGYPAEVVPAAAEVVDEDEELMEELEDVELVCLSYKRCSAHTDSLCMLCVPTWSCGKAAT